MLFNSFEFAVFLPVVFCLYWFVFQKSLKLQNLFIVIISYFFYGWWDWRFLSLIIFSSTVDYIIGLKIGKTYNKNKRKILIAFSFAVNLGFLGFFKYFNFFVDSFISTFSLMGVHFSSRSLNIILPVGLSFYTFQSLSYTIDIYRNNLKPTRNIIDFFAFVSFFPQLVAGPISRATKLLPQFYKKRVFDIELAKDGMRQILWGLFKKMVVADNAAIHVNYIFSNYSTLPASSLWIGAIYFAFQIYCDFSGYSDIAIGTSRLFGFDIMRNFAYPYFSRDIAEFWRRWHISLSTWFRDYVYFPMGGSRTTNLKIIRNILIVFTVSGFWHGANWTFIIWGLLNGLYLLPLSLSNTNRRHLNVVAEGKILPGLADFFRIVFTFFLTVVAWVFFRSYNLKQAFEYLSGMFSSTVMAMPQQTALLSIVPFIVILIIVEWIQRTKQHGLEINAIESRPLRWALYYSVILSIILFSGVQQSFIYFQF
jgi:alginate O-acetyltransferase complex protein AlgI